MPNYRRVFHPGGSYFFTHTLLERAGNDLLIRRIDALRDAVRQTRLILPFTIDAWVVLPDHFHCVITLPSEDDDFPRRWRLIKTSFSKSIPEEQGRSSKRRRKGERALWQRRYWEHLIRDERDLSAHVDYVHINPVKHRLARTVADWPYSTFHRCVEQDIYPRDWAGSAGAEELDYVE